MEKELRILALSGGGFRGLFTARVLAGLEEHAQKPIGQCFDLICGTSIGSIIAMAIGIEMPMKKVAKIIEDNGKNIFSIGKIKRILCNKNILCGKLCFFGGMSLCSAKYSNRNLYKTVISVFRDTTLAGSKHPLLIPVVNYSNGKPRMFKALCGSRFVEDKKLKMADVAMAASAAPLYFPSWQIPREYGGTIYADGALYANAPGLLGVHELVFNMKKNIDKVSLLSVGTMREDERIGKTELNRGILGWGKNARISNVAISVQENLAHFMLEQQLCERYQLIEQHPTTEQAQNLGLDITTTDAVDILCSAAKNEVQNFVGITQNKKWLEHEAISDLDEIGENQ